MAKTIKNTTTPMIQSLPSQRRNRPRRSLPATSVTAGMVTAETRVVVVAPIVVVVG